MISATDVTFGYQNNQPLFQGLHIDLPTKGSLGLLGKNGAGKTTLLKILAGLIDCPSGQAIIDEKPARPRVPQVFGKIFFVPEEFLLPKVNHLQWCKLWKPFYPNFNESNFLKLLKEFEVKIKRLDKQSFGQQKKSLLAFALSSGCPYLFLDEPSNGLDIDSQRSLKKTISEVLKTSCVVISTHHVRSFSEIFEHLVFINQGQVLLNHSLIDLERKLAIAKETASGHPIYREENPARFLYPQSQVDGETIKITEELEFFFSAALQSSEKIQACLK